MTLPPRTPSTGRNPPLSRMPPPSNVGGDFRSSLTTQIDRVQSTLARFAEMPYEVAVTMPVRVVAVAP